jgi:hypothetical protein
MPILLTTTIDRKNISALKLSRKESEVVLINIDFWAMSIQEEALLSVAWTHPAIRRVLQPGSPRS